MKCFHVRANKGSYYLVIVMDYLPMSKRFKKIKNLDFLFMFQWILFIVKIEAVF